MFEVGAWDAGAWLWWVIDVPLVAILAIAYGAASWRKRPKDPNTIRLSNEATRRLYRHDHGKQELIRQADTAVANFP